MCKALFITATGTDVGKTFVTALIVKKLREAGLNASYYKAALSGAEIKNGSLIPGDAAYVAQTAQLQIAPEKLVSYIYKTAVSPHLAAKLENKPVEKEILHRDFTAACQACDYLTVEGSGGIVCPIRWDKDEKILLEDVIRMFGLGTLVVADAALGTINACALTVSYLKQRQIPVRGIILNHYDEQNLLHCDNKKMVAELTQTPVIACVPSGATNLDIDIDALLSLYGVPALGKEQSL